MSSHASLTNSVTQRVREMLCACQCRGDTQSLYQKITLAVKVTAEIAISRILNTCGFPRRAADLISSL